MKKGLTLEEMVNLSTIFGRDIVPLLSLSAERLRGLLEKEERLTLESKKYTKKFWKDGERQKYLSEQAKSCARFGLLFLQNFYCTTDIFEREFKLYDPHSQKYSNLGTIYFRVPDYILKPQMRGTSEYVKSVAIERIEIHPSLQRLGFLTTLINEMALIGMDELVIQNVVNPTLAYHLYKKTLICDGILVLKSEPETIDFENSCTPMPSFAWNLKLVRQNIGNSD